MRKVSVSGAGNVGGDLSRFSDSKSAVDVGVLGVLNVALLGERGGGESNRCGGDIVP